MAQPWQSDFNECSLQPIPGNSTNMYWWWPAQRPYSVFPSEADAQNFKSFAWTRLVATNPSDADANVFSDLQMVVNWKDLGFVLNVGTEQNPRFVEVERNQAAISAFRPRPAPAGEA
jgi:hypothetical protein